ncbi:MAG: multidrug ABC transporter ATP-binding protein [Candidatus Fischerbacteria bacterium RBG_13_37_8]|uniref:Multidrug ABC transporter ATP-binding protein n=1 Tax=Candidatus Fischerbacteria bacterium RBG_13_37_8 TaxID=1817863 RepID=A0A1F5VMM3_9BACT|nr:MAG: multidrug ABC transporter ATP-binding protein [Candidatus Fischerbacteria bacterium RBG_13_37_8]
MTYAIETLNLVRVFGDLVAVDNLNLKVAAGTFFGFLGPNGAGKSTTIKMLCGLLKSTSGSASILGYDIEKQAEEAKKRIGVVPEELALFDRLTGAEYLTFVGRMYGMRKEVIRTRTEELLELMALHDDRKKLIVDYSLGMKKKLTLSAALIHDPQVLFLDEPFEGIDAIASRMIKDILKSLLQRGVTIFLTSHILEIVERLCSDVAIIHKSKLIAHGTLEELQSGIALKEHAESNRTMTLEEIFINLVGTDEIHKRTLSWLE